MTTKSFLALSCVGFIATAPTMAAESAAPGADAAPPEDSSTVTVNGERERRDANPKAVAPIVDTPRSLVVLPSEVIQQTGSNTLADALRTVPGITFGAAEGGNPIGDRPFIRGFDSQGSTYVDGVRDFAAQSREVFAIDTVQIVRGSDSALGGRGSAGGTINILTKQPRRNSFVAGTIGAGTDDYKRATLDVNYRLSEQIAFRAQALYHDSDVAGRDALFQKRWGFAPAVTIGIAGPTRLTLAYYHLTSHELPDSGIPYLYTAANAPLGTNFSQPAIGRVTTITGATGYVDRNTFYGLKDRDFRNTKTDQATITAEHDFGAVKLRNTSRYTHNYQGYIFLLPDDSNGNVFGTATTNPTTGAAGARGDVLTGGLVWRRANTRYGYANSLVNQTDLYGDLNTGSIKHSFAVGNEISLEKARRGTFVTRGFLNATGTEILSTGSTITPRCNTATIARYYCTSLFTPNPNDPWVNYASDTSNVASPVVKSLSIEETQNDASTLGFYGFDSITLAEPLILNIGARYDRYHSRLRPGQPVAATSVPELTRTDKLFNYQLGLVYKPTKQTSVYASYATSATPPNSLLGEGQEGNAIPTTTTAANLALLDTLKPEKTKSYEAGAKAALMGNRLNLQLAVFQTDTKNARVTGPNNTVEFIGQRRIRGVEFSVNGEILPGWTVFGGYTHLNPKIVDGGFTALAVAANGAAAATTTPVVSVNTGRQATQTAKDSVSISTTATFFEKLELGGGAYYTSRVFGGYSDNRTATQTTAGVITVNPATRTVLRTVPGYTRFDARVAYNFNKAVQLAVNVQNLTNKIYFSQAYSNHYATIAPGRSAFATLSFRY